MKLKLAGLALIATMTALLSGCADTYGVSVTNKTGQMLSVTYLDVASDGTTKPYAAGTMAKGAQFRNQTEHGGYGFGKRVRFSIPDRSPEDPTSNLELKLSDDRVRDYDLVVVNGRLVAKEYTKARPENARAD